MNHNQHPHQTPPPKFRPPQRNNSFTYVLIFALILTIAYYVFNPKNVEEDSRTAEIPISQIVQEYQAGQYHLCLNCPGRVNALPGSVVVKCYACLVQQSR